MAQKRNPVRKRRPPTQLLVSEESKAAPQAWLDSQEGQRCLDQCVTLIAEWATSAMPTDLLQALVEEKAHATCEPACNSDQVRGEIGVQY